MPELPEVETTLRGIKSRVLKQQITEIIVRHPQLRWPIPQFIKTGLNGQIVRALTRRAKYLLFTCDTGTLILHLGMSGRLHILANPGSAGKHDHVDIYFKNGYCLRFTDPRRFGALLWTDKDPAQHALLKNIGPEPLSADFDGDYLFSKSRKKKIAVKSFIMNSNIVAGVGNIYAAEALFMARIHPQTPAGAVTAPQFKKLVRAIRQVLEHAIEKGGTTLKDFRKSDGTPGYFSIELKAYGNGGKPCPRCKTTLESMQIAKRATVYCPKCQA